MSVKRSEASAVLFGLGLVLVVNGAAQADDPGLDFPDSYADGVHYGTVERGNITEELYTSRDAIRAAKNDKPFPDGTVIVMEDFRGGDLHRYVIMEKGDGWGEAYPPDVRAGDWRFAEFTPDGTLKEDVDVTRCMSCHQSQEGQDYVFTVGQMKDVDLDESAAE